MKRAAIFITAIVLSVTAHSQERPSPGIISGIILDEKSKALEGVTVQLIDYSDSLGPRSAITDKTGQFGFANIPFGTYRLSVSYVGLQPLVIDSISFRPGRYDFNMGDITLKPRSTDNLDAVVVYSEKPLIQSKDGNIIFNAGESAIAAGSNASELLSSVPLVAKDPDGKITVRGKEPKILIDDKPVELNLQQLQDLLESMPGSSIEKIEVMTNPPPQYANEQGGVINIVTKKGKVGMSGRASVTAGTLGDINLNGSFTYRKQGLVINVNAGGGYNRFQGNGYSIRNNIYRDSSNFFNTTNGFVNKSIRPNIRVNVDYDINKNNLLAFTLNYNQNRFDNTNLTEYANINRSGETWRLSRRQVSSAGSSYSPNATASYTWKGKPGESLRLVAIYSYSGNSSDRDFYQEFLDPADQLPNGIDSFQQQLNTTRVNSHTIRADYNRMLRNRKTFLSFGSVYSRNNNRVLVDASYRRKADGAMVPMEMLSNDLWFHQTVNNYRASVRQILGDKFSFTAGTSLERTHIWFELLKEGRDAKNDYWTWLPFANINKNWNDRLNLTVSYRRSIRRPGIRELNPTIDFSDPYNIRFGNEKLEASTAHNFDVVLGRTTPRYFVNLGLGHNIVEDIFSQLRTLQADGITQITWENISGRKEYEISTWNGLTLTRKIRVNMSASYTHNRYSAFDKSVRKFRDGGSFTSNINTNISPADLWNVNASFNINRFANPQGYARWNTSMNVGVQRKFFNKKLVVTVNAIDPLNNQRRRTFTYGTNFNLESFSSTRTRNFRVSMAYNFTRQPKKKPSIQKAVSELKAKK